MSKQRPKLPTYPWVRVTITDKYHRVLASCRVPTPPEWSKEKCAGELMGVLDHELDIEDVRYNG